MFVVPGNNLSIPVSKRHRTNFLKDITKKMRKKVKEYALVSAEKLYGNCHTEFIQSLNLLPPDNHSKLNDQLVSKLAKFMEFCETSICNK